MEQRDIEQKNTLGNGQSLTEQGENSFYQKHAILSVMSKKTEKIATAIYMVTDFVHESEPLRRELRTLALALMSSVRKAAARSSEPHRALSDEISRTIDETAAFIVLATTIGMISEMNGSILRTELEKVQKEIDAQFGGKNAFVVSHPGYANLILQKSFFEVPGNETILPKYSKGHDIYKGHQDQQKQAAEKASVQDNRIESFSKKSDLGIKIARRNDVLSVVRNKGKVSIKDVVSILKDISEKTVQRELLALVREGVLMKQGEKRWSTYSVAQ